MMEVIENNDKSFEKELEIEPGFSILKISNDHNSVYKYKRDIDQGIIQLHFSLKNQVLLLFNQGAYSVPVAENSSLLLYNPQKDLPLHLHLDPFSKYMVLLITIERFHSFFTIEAGLISFLNDENVNRHFYNNKNLEPDEIVVLNQLFNYGLHHSLEKLYTKGKVFELLSLYFNQSDDEDTQKCPFLEDEENVEKIRKAKNILIENMSNPPSLSNLSYQVNISIQHLKDGFKQIYGDTAYSYLLNYKLEYARKLLLSKKYNVAETSFEVGYSTPSHFITAFKRKFGATPKRYLKSIKKAV
jgi:AraC-like DNA-binding protein